MGLCFVYVFLLRVKTRWWKDALPPDWMFDTVESVAEIPSWSPHPPPPPNDDHGGGGKWLSQSGVEGGRGENIDDTTGWNPMLTTPTIHPIHPPSLPSSRVWWGAVTARTPPTNNPA